MWGRWTTLQKSGPVTPLSIDNLVSLRAWRTFSSSTSLQAKHKPTPKLGRSKTSLANSDEIKLEHTSLKSGPAAADHGLPLSPLMNPKMVAARNRYRNPKPSTQDSKSSAFSEKLKRNPYGISHYHNLCNQLLILGSFLSPDPRNPSPQRLSDRNTTPLRIPSRLHHRSPPCHQRTMAYPRNVA